MSPTPWIVTQTSLPTPPPTFVPIQNWFPTASPSIARGHTIAALINAKSWIETPLRYGAVVDNPSAEEMALDWLIYSDTTTMVSDETRLLQRYALLTFWFQRCDPWYSETGWATPHVHECDWSNLDCDLVNGQRVVTELQMEKNNLQGTISPDIALFSSLQNINLEDNPVKGSIPSSIGQSTKLTFMDLGPNLLTGTLPTTLGNLTLLQFFSVNLCPELKGTIPQEMSRWIHRIDRAAFYGTQLSGTMPLCNVPTDRNIERIVVDCDRVDCPCCTHCCPGQWNGIQPFTDGPCQ